MTSIFFTCFLSLLEKENKNNIRLVHMQLWSDPIVVMAEERCNEKEAPSRNEQKRGAGYHRTRTTQDDSREE